MSITPRHQPLCAPLCITLYIIAYASYVNGFTFQDCVLNETEDNQRIFLCYLKDLKHVPPKIPVNITVINIAENNITRIGMDDFKNLKYLEILNISQNSICHVDTGAFRHLISLTLLNLRKNHLTKITNEFFSGLTNLKVLLMDFNAILTIAPSAFSIFSKLEYVQLSSNNLTSIVCLQPVFQVKTLKELQIAHNNISHFQSKDISDSSLQLQFLNLSSNPISIFRITDNIFPNLTAIDLSCCFQNPLSQWIVGSPEFFRNVRTLHLNGINIPLDDFNFILQTFNKSLEWLSLRNVHSVKAFTRNACLIPTLRALELQDNSMTYFTETGLDKCTHLKTLYLSNNNLTQLEEFLPSIRNLTTLNLSHNNFASITKIAHNSPMLVYLNVVFNNIKVIECDTWQSTNGNLKVLKMYKNSIYKINECVFQNLTGLKDLDLDVNNIVLLSGAFKNGPANLENLRMRANQLHSIKVGDLNGLRSLTHLDLADNQIESIEAGAFDSLTSLETLVLERNKITDTYLTPNVFSGLSNLHKLTLQINYILRTKRYETPPFSNLKSLHTLLVFSQYHFMRQTYLPANLLWNLTSLKKFNAKKVGFKYLNEDVFKDNTELTELCLSGNDLTFLSPKTFLPLRNLIQLSLENCNLKTLDFITRAKLHTLLCLKIRDNKISFINETIIQALPALTLLQMSGNTFICGCSNEGFIKWVETNNRTQVPEANKFECINQPNLIRKKLLELDLRSCSVDFSFFCFMSSTSVVLLTMVTSLLYHFLRWKIVYTYYLFLSFLYDKKKKDPKKSRFQYDAFISYNLHDEHWVTGTLLPKLEGEQGWRLCLHHRDFQPGKLIMDNIIDGIYGSRKTICIISQHYLESEWCSREVQVASFRLFDEKKDVLILVFLEDIPDYRLSAYYRIRSLVKKRTYLRWPKAGEDTGVFWEKLRLALGTERESEERNSLSDIQNVL